MKDATAKRLSRWHTRLFRASRGRVGKRLVDNDMLLLTTTGRLTGASHTVPLLYLRSGDELVVFASWGGRDRHPEWYENLRAEPQATVELPSESFAVLARTASGEERDRWWDRAVAAYHGYDAYQAKTSRLIPVVVLTPLKK